MAAIATPAGRAALARGWQLAKNALDFLRSFFIPFAPGRAIAMLFKLTPRQQQVLDVIKTVIVETGAPPTRAEISARLGFKSANAAQEHLQTLAQKGVIDLVRGASRGIRLRGDAKVTLTDLSDLPAENLELPLVGHVAAGSPVLAIEHVEQTCRVQAHLFSRRPDYLLRVRGMSMRDAGIIDGDWLAVQSAREAYNGQIVVARLGDEVTVKRFYRHGDAIELHPENPDYAPITVPCGEPFAIEGLAVGLIRSNMLI